MRRISSFVFELTLALAMSAAFAQTGGSLQLLGDFNQSHSLSDIVHLGDNPSDCRFIPPNPSGITWTSTFNVSADQLTSPSVSLLIDQYQADNSVLADRSFVTIDGVFVGFLSLNQPIVNDLCKGTTVPVVTDSFSISSYLHVGTDTVVVQAGLSNPGGTDQYDDFDITNIRIGGLATPTPTNTPTDTETPTATPTPTLQSTDFLDPVSSLLSNGQVTTNANVLATQGVKVKGVATDGVARLVLRFNAASAGTATFSLVDSNGQPITSNDENGQIQDLQGSQMGNSVTVSTASTSQGEKAFAVFIAPSQFVRAAVPVDQSTTQRQIFIDVQFTPTSGQTSDTGMTPVTLIRPMVFLVHGIWSSFTTWDHFGGLAGTDPRFDIQRADYSWISDRGFSNTAPVVYDQLKVYLNFFKRDHNVAAVQADVVSHSMGGPVVRTIALRPNYLNDPLFPTFGGGPIRKLITIAGVHKGTPLADYLVHEPCVESVFYVLRYDPYGGAVDDLTPASAAITSINGPGVQTPFVAHTIVGLATSEDKADVELWINTVGSFFACWNLIHFDFDRILGVNNDLLVPESSQVGFDINSPATENIGGTVHSPPFPTLTFDPAETSHIGIANRVIDLLDESVHDPTVFSPLPH